MQFTIIQLTDTAGLNDLRYFLEQSKLPSDDVVLAGNCYVGIRDAQNNLIASGGLEFHEPYALLRSVAVDPGYQGNGYAISIVKHLISTVQQSHFKAVYLLTETAEMYFSKLDFRTVERDDVPEVIKDSYQYHHACPATATCMVRHLAST